MIRSNQINIDQNHQLSTKSCCLFNSKKVLNNNHRHHEKIKKQSTIRGINSHCHKRHTFYRNDNI